MRKFNAHQHRATHVKGHGSDRRRRFVSEYVNFNVIMSPEVAAQFEEEPFELPDFVTADLHPSLLKRLKAAEGSILAAKVRRRTFGNINKADVDELCQLLQTKAKQDPLEDKESPKVLDLEGFILFSGPLLGLPLPALSRARDESDSEDELPPLPEMLRFPEAEAIFQNLPLDKDGFVSAEALAEELAGKSQVMEFLESQAAKCSIPMKSREKLERLINWRIERDDALGTLFFTFVLLIIFYLVVQVNLDIKSNQEAETAVRSYISTFGSQLSGPFMDQHISDVTSFWSMEFPKLRRQSEDVVSLEEDHGGFSRLTSTNTAEEVSHLHHCSPCSRVGDASCSMEELEFSEQNSSAAMDSVRSAFSTFEARSNFSKLRQELVHRQRMIDAVSRRHRRALTGKARPGAEGAVVPAPRFSRAEAGKAKEASDEPRQRDVTGSPKRTELKDVRPIQELKGWKKRNLRGSKADSFNERKVAAQSPSRRKAMEMRETALHQPAPCEDRWESVKHSATFSRSPNLEAVMVQRSWRKQMIRSLRQQPMVPMVEVKDLYDLLNDPQSWRLSSSQRCPMEGWTDEQTEAVPLPRSSNASPAPHRPARRFSRPIKRSERPATVGPSTFQLPQDLEETVWSVVDLSS